MSGAANARFRAAGQPYSVQRQPWPEVDEEAAKEDVFTLFVQANGKLRDRLVVPVGISAAEAEERALASESAQGVHRRQGGQEGGRRAGAAGPRRRR